MHFAPGFPISAAVMPLVSPSKAPCSLVKAGESAGEPTAVTSTATIVPALCRSAAQVANSPGDNDTAATSLPDRDLLPGIPCIAGADTPVKLPGQLKLTDSVPHHATGPASPHGQLTQHNSLHEGSVSCVSGQRESAVLSVEHDGGGTTVLDPRPGSHQQRSQRVVCGW